MPAYSEGVEAREPPHFQNGHAGMINGNGYRNGNGYLDEDIVISGISGHYPESRNVEEFKQKLFAGVDLITENDRRWPADTPGIPPRMGTLSDLEYFDASFFHIHAKQANVMDPQLRMLLELTYEALIDSGTNPEDVRGTKTGVFIGVTTNDSVDIWFPNIEHENMDGYGVPGCCRAMFANRLSFAFDFQGPSFSMDTASSSSMYALQQAYFSLRHGQCDAAIVGGVNLCLSPMVARQLAILNMLSPDGKCKTFDASANGYARAESATVVYLQRASEAKRVYATILNAKGNADGAKEEGIMFPSGAIQKQLIRETFKEINLSPLEVSYVETHGTGTKAGDNQEVNTITDFFCPDRKTPLLVGSVKSNMGHAEAGSGLCSITKCCIALESGAIPPTLHFKEPNPTIPGLLDGRLQVVDRVTPLAGDIIAVNSFGFGGTNAHAILRANRKTKSTPPEGGLPRVVGVSGRTKDAVDFMLKRIGEHPKDYDLCGLIHEIHKRPIPGHKWRGYSVLGATTPLKEIAASSGGNRPVWYVFCGIGSQWCGMADTLMELDVFRLAVQKCAKALKPHGLDLISILTSQDAATFKNILNCFVSISTIHVALVDVLTALGISPDGILGHSVGELGCAYADGTFTAEQTVLAAYYRGRAVLDSKLPQGSMATVGVSRKEIETRAPPNITIACHNSADNVTLSGPPNDIANFVNTLQSEGKFAKEVDSSGVAFHSKFIADAAPIFLEGLKKILPSPKPRTSRWISSSIPEKTWNSDLAQQSSPAYHVNNFVSPVLFNDAMSHIPENAIVIEIGPHSLLQAILKRSLDPNTINVGLLKKGTDSNISVLLSSLGKLYNGGLNPNFAALYPPVKFPVARGTPMLQSLIKWDHSTEWAVPYVEGYGLRPPKPEVRFDLSKESDSYLAGHVINGDITLPISGYIVSLWQTLAQSSGRLIEELPLIIEDIKLHNQAIIPQAGAVKFEINMLKGSGAFEFVKNGTVVFSGKSRIPDAIDEEQLKLNEPTNVDTQNLPLAKSDIYKGFYYRGHNYSGLFQGIQEADNKGIKGKISWADNWISYLESILQFSIVGLNSSELHLPSQIQRISINPKKHFQILDMVSNQENTIPVFKYEDINILKSGGVEIRGLKTKSTPRAETPAPNFIRSAFVPYVSDKVINGWSSSISNSQALTFSVQIALENSSMTSNVKIVEIGTDKKAENLLVAQIVKTLGSEPRTLDITVVSNSTEGLTPALEPLGIKTATKDITTSAAGQNCQLVIATGCLSKPKIVANMTTSAKSGGFLLFEESLHFDDGAVKPAGLEVISRIQTTDKTYILLRKAVNASQEPSVINVTSENYDWVENLKSALSQSKTTGNTVLAVSQGDPTSGIIGMVNCIKYGTANENIRSVFVQDATVPKLSLTSALYSDQLKKDLLHNVHKNGQWGSFRYFGAPEVSNGTAVNGGDLSCQRLTEKSVTSNGSSVTKAQISSSKSYLVLDGLSDYGLELTNWLVNRGAAKIVLVTAEGICDGYRALRVRHWTESGVHIVIRRSRCRTITETIKVLEETTKLDPVGGIFCLSLLSLDAVLDSETPADFEILTPKLNGVKCLDTVSRQICSQLDFFVSFSFVARGRNGQSSYAFANSTAEKICEARRDAGLPGVAIDLESIDVSPPDAKAPKLSMQPFMSCLAIFDTLLEQPYPVLSSKVIAKKSQKSSNSGPSSVLADTIARILGFKDATAVDLSTPLVDLGMDSIMGHEIQNVVDSHCNSKLSLQEIRHLSFTQLSAL